MAATADIPCVRIPSVKPLKISLPFGVDLTSMADISKGPPSDCTLIHSLMLQLAPALAGLECLLKILTVVAKIASVKQPTDILDVAKAAADVLKCANFAIKIPCMIVDILKLILAYLLCIIDAVESVLKFQVGLDFNAADGNPVLLASLNCAQNNADASLSQLREALRLIEPLLAVLDSIKSLGSALPGPVSDAFKLIPEALSVLKTVIEGGNVSAGLSGTEKMVKTLDDVKSKLQMLRDLLDELPC